MTGQTSKILTLISLLAFTSNAFSQYKYSISLGGSHERLFEAYGNHLRIYYNFSDNLRLNTEFVRFYEVTEKSANEAVGYDYRELNLNISYALLIGEKEKLGTYALLGFTYNYGRKANRTATDTNETFSESIGMTFGLGAFYKIGRFMPYIESRNVFTGSRSYLIHSVGIAVSLGKLNED